MPIQLPIRSLSKATRVDVYDAFAEEKRGEPVKVAEVTVRGGKGTLTVLDPSLAPTLRDVFEQPTTLFRGGQRAIVNGQGDERSSLGADAVVVLEPWSKDAIDHALAHGLPAHRLRGLLVSSR